jgi:hypothetical protein
VVPNYATLNIRMNHYAPRQKHDLLWHYTVSNGGHIRAVGNCSPYQWCLCSKNDRYRQEDMQTIDDCDLCHGHKYVLNTKNPCPGHATAQEACNHYKEYLLDNAEFNYGDETSRLYKCDAVGCEEKTRHYANCKGHFYHLCDHHHNRTGLGLAITVWETWTS